MPDYCRVHHSGGIANPCAWPDCPDGHATDVYVSTARGLSPKRYSREYFIAADGEPRYFWISDTESYGWIISGVIRGELYRIASQDASTIYHYTSLDGFQGIIDSGDLWLTESAFLNDASEVNHGIELSKEIFESLPPELLPIHGFLKDVIDTPISKRPRINIACFSRAHDSLSQWRGYGGGHVGVSIGFDTKNFLSSFGYPQCQLGYVLYDEEKKMSLLKTYFLFQLEAYRKDSKRIVKVLQRDNSYKEILPIMGYDTTLQYLYFDLVTSCKHSDFVDEHEVRLFYTEHSNVLDSFSLAPAKTRFRKGDGFLAPYTTLKDICNVDRNKRMQAERLSITEVTIAPHPRSELTALSVRRFLDDRGYGDVPVVRSKSPYR